MSARELLKLAYFVDYQQPGSWLHRTLAPLDAVPTPYNADISKDGFRPISRCADDPEAVARLASISVT